MEKQFFMIWNPQGHPPRYKHCSYASAEAEAKRLAAENEGQTFYVLVAVGKAKKVTVQYEKFDGELPF